ncbi:C-C motif chemokine 7-like [Mobula birostris]|uniref:C-C motif chemokine 7-like n=1 Tax=Mobula birostris TaxID=1983395 RepID=UPI003B2891C3
MKAAFYTVVLLTALAICSQRAAAAPDGSITMGCCERFKVTCIPYSRLKSYEKALFCPTPAIIFSNRRNMKICAKASEQWVKAAVKYLDRKH